MGFSDLTIWKYATSYVLMKSPARTIKAIIDKIFGLLFIGMWSKVRNGIMKTKNTSNQNVVLQGE